MNLRTCTKAYPSSTRLILSTKDVLFSMRMQQKTDIRMFFRKLGFFAVGIFMLTPAVSRAEPTVNNPVATIYACTLVGSLTRAEIAEVSRLASLGEKGGIAIIDAAQARFTACMVVALAANAANTVATAAAVAAQMVPSK